MPEPVIFSDGGWPRPWCYSIAWFGFAKQARVTISDGVVVCEWQFPRAELTHRSQKVAVNHAVFAPPGAGRRTLELTGENGERAHIIFPLPGGMRTVRDALARGGFVVEETRSLWIPRDLGPEWDWVLRRRREQSQ